MTKKKYTSESVVDLWKNNRVDQHYKLTFGEVRDKFLASSFFETWRKGYGFDRIMRLFMTAPESEGGLASVFDNKVYNELMIFVFNAACARDDELRQKEKEASK